MKNRIAVILLFLSFNSFAQFANEQIIIQNAGNSTVSIFDCTGRVVETFSGAGDHTKINVTNLQNGIYFVSIADGNKLLNEKFIKQ